MKRPFKIATFISACFLGVTLLLAVATLWLNPWDHYLSFGTVHVGVEGRGLDIRLVFFNDAEYGPYSGSIIGFVDSEGNVYPPLKREIGFGDTWGIYYRYFESGWSDAILWTLRVSLWYPAAVFAVLPAIWCTRRCLTRAAGRVARSCGISKSENSWTKDRRGIQ